MKTMDSKAAYAVVRTIYNRPELIPEIERVISDDDMTGAPGAIYGAIKSLVQRGSTVDYITVYSELTEQGKGAYYAAFESMVGDKSPLIGDKLAMEYAGIIKEESAKIRLQRLSDQIGAALADDTKPDSIVKMVEDSVKGISTSRMAMEERATDDIATATVDEIIARANDPARSQRILTGWQSVDSLLTSISPGKMTIIGARPAMGKTAFALNIGYNAAEAGKRVLLFSLEMSAEQLMQRLLAMAGMIDSYKLDNPDKLQPDDADRLLTAAERIKQLPLIIRERALTLRAIEQECRRQAMQGIDLIIIDYLQLIDDGQTGDNLNAAVTRISRKLKLLSMELKTPIIVLSQLSRALEGRQNKHPILSDLRDSGAIEQDADAVVFLCRPEYYEPLDQPGVCDVEVAKQRSGRTGRISLRWTPEFTLFSEKVEKIA